LLYISLFIWQQIFSDYSLWWSRNGGMKGLSKWKMRSLNVTRYCSTNALATDIFNFSSFRLTHMRKELDTLIGSCMASPFIIGRTARLRHGRDINAGWLPIYCISFLIQKVPAQQQPSATQFAFKVLRLSRQ